MSTFGILKGLPRKYASRVEKLVRVYIKSMVPYSISQVSSSIHTPTHGISNPTWNKQLRLVLADTTSDCKQRPVAFTTSVNCLIQRVVARTTRGRFLFFFKVGNCIDVETWEKER